MGQVADGDCGHMQMLGFQLTNLMQKAAAIAGKATMPNIVVVVFEFIG